MISEYISRKRKINGTITVLLVSIGLISIGIGFFQLLSDVKTEPDTFTVSKALRENCIDSLRMANLVPDTNNTSGPILVEGFSLENPRNKLYDASIGIQQCIGYKVRYFCMGPDCANKINITLTPLEG